MVTEELISKMEPRRTDTNISLMLLPPKEDMLVNPRGSGVICGIIQRVCIFCKLCNFNTPVEPDILGILS